MVSNDPEPSVSSQDLFLHNDLWSQGGYVQAREKLYYCPPPTGTWSFMLSLYGGPILFFWAEIRRCLSSRLFSLTYNPMFKNTDLLPSSVCFYLRGGYYICDEKLHIICSNCLKTCIRCGKSYCSICQISGFLRCGSLNESRRKNGPINI